MKKIISLFAVSLFVISAEASRVDTIAIVSKAMECKIKTIVISPDVANGETAVKCPVIYLLHGYGGNEFQWLVIKPNLPQIADEKGIIFVCPDGKNSWYIDSPIDKKSQYETFISSELIEYIDQNYNTLDDRSYRAITGLSMGGHGALFNAFRHSDVFGAAGSMSGAVDIRQIGNKYGLNLLIGNKSEDKKFYAVPNQLLRLELEDAHIFIYFDCGIKDFTFAQNEILHKLLTEKNIEHAYTVRPGAHTHAYWRNSIDYHILFFCKFFSREE
ncbi:MAG: esterase family protein [Candidatus Symbiothrix sp.]|jgi:S-formylglutathione hydrolase FrmB|nr:esterase family protein [Candidatus Symbiothrix sp.]